MEQGIFFPLIQNAALLLALVFVYDAIPRRHKRKYFLLWRLGIGVIVGAIGMTIMSTPWVFAPGIIFDTRSVLLAVSGLFFGGLPTTVAVIMTAAYRYAIGGPAVWIGIAVIISSGAVGALWRSRRKSMLASMGWGELYGIGFLVHLIMLSWMLFLPWETAKGVLTQITLPVLTIYPLATMMVGRLLSRRIEIERDDKMRLQDDFLFRSQFDAGNIGIAIGTVDKCWIKVNSRLCQMFKYSEKELLRLGWDQLSHPDDLYTDTQQFERLLLGEIDQYELKKRFFAKDGTLVYTLMSVSCKRSGGRVQLVIAGFLDITEQTLAEQSVSASREQLQLVLDSGELGFWDWDIPRDDVIRNERCAQMLGVSHNELMENHRIWVNAIHPDDRVEMLRAMELHLQGRTASYSIDYRLKTADGTERWIRDRGRVVASDGQGKPLRMCGIHVDITQSRKQQESLELAASVYNSSSEAMSVLDAKGHIITINAAFSRITGYNESEVQGQHVSLFNCDTNGENFYREMNQQLREKGHWQGEMWQKRKNGDEYLIWLTVNTIYDRQHRPHRRVALFSDITEMKQQEQLIWQQANYDPLTGLPNRRMLLDYLGREIIACERRKRHFALLFLDLDFFKEINDTLGHDMGDQLLVECSRRLQLCVRDSDVVARLGGDEFTVILRDIADQSGVERVAAQILKALAEPYQLGEHTSYISASIGITLYPEDADSREALLKHADQAMYAAKAQGRNRFNFFTPSMQEYAHFRMHLIQDLRLAVERQEFSLFFQPIVELKSGDIHKAEVLLRWQHETRGYVSPADFIPVAEETGLILEIGAWVLEQAARQSKEWQQKHERIVQLSINKSPIQFRDEGEYFSRWMSLLKELQLGPGGICVEITEGLLLDAATGVSDKLLAYRDAGIQVALDDFGTGYSSLAYLKKFDIDYLKIDQSFIRNLVDDSSDHSLCEAIIVMAHKLGMKVIAEGVESEDQRELLRNMGCDYAQGYLFSRPMSAAEFEQEFLLDAKANA
ncbi:EAL domain-containing protein [Shewanella cyperi]|uniref:EAL domain-containing protein n=1 Tax=Shewanella cyperi TaxID=2814292 RepID=UPI001A950F06|nr:EAL domain-containing protein [Shewanella cyperi]QSX41771.1 EAL domain-containing protein [Shewanella cyperi]